MGWLLRAPEEGPRREALGPAVTVKLSQWDVSRFTEGDCHILAQAIYKRTGWPIYGFDGMYYDGEPGCAYHCFVLMPDGRVLDVEGPQGIKEFKEKWGQQKGKIIPFSERDREEWGGPQWYGHHGGSPKYSKRRARILAKRLLESLT